MDRLTKPLCGGYELPMIPMEVKTQDDLQKFHEVRKFYESCVIRCGQYEDTGLSPEEIYEVRFLIAAQRDPQKLARLRELVLADQNCQLVVLPCKVGDSVYIPDFEKKIPVKVRVQGISISVSGRTILHFGGYPVECAWGDGCGKDWFLTREEAEAAVAEKGSKNE